MSQRTYSMPKTYKLKNSMEIFYCYEFLLMKRLQEDAQLWEQIRAENWEDLNSFMEVFHNKILLPKGDGNNKPISKYKKISSDLWFLAVTLEKSPQRLMTFLNSELQRESSLMAQIPGQTVLARYIYHNNFVEMHLDSVFKYGDTSILPKELMYGKDKGSMRKVRQGIAMFLHSYCQEWPHSYSERHMAVAPFISLLIDHINTRQNSIQQ